RIVAAHVCRLRARDPSLWRIAPNAVQVAKTFLITFLIAGRRCPMLRKKENENGKHKNYNHWTDGLPNPLDLCMPGRLLKPSTDGQIKSKDKKNSVYVFSV